MEVPSSSREAERLRALARYDLINRLPEERYDRIARLASRLLRVPIALVTLVGEDRQWFKARHGLNALEIERVLSFCATVVRTGSALVVPDARIDPRFSTDPLVVTMPGIRFYAGAPLTTADGFPIGTICLLDVSPRAFSSTDAAILRDLADAAVEELDHGRQSIQSMLDAAEQLRQASSWYGDAQAALQNAVEGIARIGDGGEYIAANAAYAALLGYRPEELIGRPWESTVHPDDLEPLRAAHRAMRSAGTGEAEVRGVRRDGSVFHQHVRLAAAPSQRGVPGGFYGFIQDVTERKQAVAELREYEARYRALTELVCTCTFCCTVGADGSATLGRVGPEAGDVTGYTAEELTGTALERIVHPEELPRFEELFRDVLDGRTMTIETRILTRAGRERALRILLHPELDKRSGRVARIHGAAQDVSLRAPEAEPGEPKGGDELSYLKTALLSNMSYEIRTPLATILGYTSLLSEEVDGRHRDFLRSIEQSAHRLQETLNSLLELAQLEARRFQLVRERLDAAECVRQAVNRLRPLAEEKSLAFHVELPEAPVPVETDRVGLSHAVASLAGEAVRCTAAGEVRVRVEEEEEEVRICVAHSGPGPEAFRGLLAGAAGRSGADAGLGVVRRLVTRMGGTTAVREREGGGSVLVMMLPRPEPAGFAADLPPAQGPSVRRHVLLVAPEPAVQRQVERLLRSRCQLFSAGSCEEAVRTAESLRFDAVLVDAALAGGRPLSDLRAREAYRGVPFIALGTDGPPPAGFEAALPAPADADRLLEAIEEVLCPAAR